MYSAKSSHAYQTRGGKAADCRADGEQQQGDVQAGNPREAFGQEVVFGVAVAHVLTAEEGEVGVFFEECGGVIADEQQQEAQLDVRERRGGLRPGEADAAHHREGHEPQDSLTPDDPVGEAQPDEYLGVQGEKQAHAHEADEREPVVGGCGDERGDDEPPRDGKGYVDNREQPPRLDVAMVYGTFHLRRHVLGRFVRTHDEAYHGVGREDGGSDDAGDDGQVG